MPFNQLPVLEVDGVKIAQNKTIQAYVGKKLGRWQNSSSYHYISIKNKTVLLRERKRHTTRRVASTRDAVLSYIQSIWGGGIPPSSPDRGHPILVMEVPPSGQYGGTPILPTEGGTPS